MVTNHAAKLRERVRHSRMRTERLLSHITETGFLQGDMAGCATIRDAAFRKSIPDECHFEIAAVNDPHPAWYGSVANTVFDNAATG